MRIITENIYPPIPNQRFDWCAYYEGQKELGSYGYGCTEQDAIDDLVINYPDMRIVEALTFGRGTVRR